MKHYIWIYTEEQLAEARSNGYKITTMGLYELDQCIDSNAKFVRVDHKSPALGVRYYRIQIQKQSLKDRPGNRFIFSLYPEQRMRDSRETRS